MVFRPAKHFSLIESIQSVFNLTQETPSTEDIVTWVTSGTQSTQENTEKNITLSASSSAGGTISYSKIGGADQALFSLVGSTLTLSAKNYELPEDSDTNNTYIVQVRATSTAGGTADLTITLTVSNVNEPPNFSLTGANVSGNNVSYTNDDIGTQEDIVFGALESQYLTITNPESSDTVTLTLTISGGASLTLGSTSGLTFNTGDGVNDTTLEFFGTLGNINNAIDGLQVITPTSIGTYTLSVTIFDGNNTTGPTNISIVRANPLAETQLVTFEGIPNNGTWRLGVDNTDNELFSYNNTSSDIETALRANPNITAVWGSDLTVTGNYTIGFTVTASTRGNLGTLYFDDSELSYETTIQAYAYGGINWDGMNNLLAVDGSNATTTVAPSSTSPTLKAIFDFNDFPDITPNGIEVTLTCEGQYIIDWAVYLADAAGNDMGNNQASGANWASGGMSNMYYGGSTNLWGVGISSNDWQSIINNASGIGFNLTCQNTDIDYPHTAYIDAILMKIWYNTYNTISISTTQNGT